ncbi:hypothetical protein LI328DRAFT_95621 [Trichoderma asperelloides]|nr:hypothetical protein LI328DRAFT_95621 [Trichoderma asperelloides]
MGPKSAMEPVVRLACSDDNAPRRPTAVEGPCVLASGYLLSASDFPVQARCVTGWWVGSSYGPVANLQGMESKIPRCKGSGGFASRLKLRLELIAVLRWSLRTEMPYLSSLHCN